MKRFSLGIAALAAAGLFVASLSFAAPTGTSTVTLAALATATVQILDPAMTLSPNATDYDNDYVEAAGASGLRVRVRTNSNTGMGLYVRCADAVPQIALADLLVRTQTAAGTGGSTMSTYGAITAVNQALWSTTVPTHVWATVTTDVRVQNLIGYNDAISAGTTNYTNTLTYTVIAQ